MNEASEQRVEWARAVADVYAGHPRSAAIILGGSAARGTADDHSDIDLGLFWHRLPTASERDELRVRLGGRLDRFVDNQRRYRPDNPRHQGGIEIVTLPRTTGRPQVTLDLEHETAAGTEAVIAQVIDQGDLSLEKQELLSVIQTGLVLHGRELVERWRRQTGRYPSHLAEKMVARHLSGIGDRLSRQLDWLDREEWFCLADGFLEIGRRLLLAHMGLNRVWAFTDNPGFKGLKPFVTDLELAPDGFVDRLGKLFQSEAFIAIPGFATLAQEVIDLARAQFPDLNAADERETLGRIRATIAASGR